MQASLLVFLSCLVYGTNAKICSSGYTLVNDKCWQMITKFQPRDDAAQACASSHGGAFMDMPANSDENAALLNFVRNSQDKHYKFWMGMMCLDNNKNHCTWDTNNQVSGYFNFVSGSPNTWDDCVAFQNDTGKWENVRCDANLPTVCELPPTNKDCGSNCDVNFNNNCYTLVQDSKTFDDAESHCKSMGMHLASIHSQFEYHRVARLYKNKGNYWLGGKLPSDNKVTWNDGTSQDFLADNRVLDGNCMQMEVLDSGEGGKWLGKNCGYKPSQYICKRKVKSC